MIADLFLLAACGGVFSVPLYAIIQDAAAASERSRMIGANNIMNALFMVAGAGAAAAFAAGGMGAPGVLRITAVANLLVAVWIALILTRGVRGGERDMVDVPRERWVLSVACVPLPAGGTLGYPAAAARSARLRVTRAA